MKKRERSRRIFKILIFGVAYLMLLSIIPSSGSASPENAPTEYTKTAKSPDVTNVRIVYDTSYKTSDYTCWSPGWGSCWNGTQYNDLNVVKNAGVVRRNTTFTVTGTGASVSTNITIKGPTDSGYRSTMSNAEWSVTYWEGGKWNFTIPPDAPVGDYQIYMDNEYCTLYVIFNVFEVYEDIGNTDNEFDSWAYSYNEDNDAAEYSIGQYPGTPLLTYGHPFEERTVELACSVMGENTITPFEAAVNLYRVINARVIWSAGTGSETDLVWLLNAGTALTVSKGKKVALQTGEKLPEIDDAQCTHFCVMMSTWPRSIGVPARSVADTSTADLYSDYWGWHNWAEVYIQNPDMTLSPTDPKWLVFDASDHYAGYDPAYESSGCGSIDTTHQYTFAANRLDTYSSEAISNWRWDGAGYTASDYPAVAETGDYSYDITDIPTINPGDTVYGWIGDGDRDFFRIDVSTVTSIDIGFVEGAEYAQIYVDADTTGTNVPVFSPAGGDLKTDYDATLLWGGPDDKVTGISIGGSVNYLYVMVDNAKGAQYADDYWTQGRSEAHRWEIACGPQPPKVTVINPNGGETLVANGIYSITWNATDLNDPGNSLTVDIHNSTNSGESWDIIATNEPNDGFYTWNVPDLNIDTCRIKVVAKDTDSMTGNDTSDSDFSIKTSVPLNEITSGTGASANDRFGWNVSGAGDINGDYINDIIVGAPFAAAGGTERGAVYIFFGYSSIDLSNINAANANVTINGITNGGHLGWSVSNTGDVNGNGKDDVIIGAPDTTNGNAYIFYGETIFDGGTWTVSSADVTLSGEASGDKFGCSVSGAGDVTNDNYDDVIVGAYAYGNDKGRAYVYYGGNPMDSTVDVTLKGKNDNDRFGFSVSGAGNVNNDNYDDVIVGAPRYDGSKGRAYVYYGYSGMGEGGGLETVFFDGFESGDFTAGGWTVNDLTPGGVWEVSNSDPNTGVYHALWNLVESFATGERSIVKVIDTTGCTGITVEYAWKSRDGAAPFLGTFGSSYSTSGASGPWTVIEQENTIQAWSMRGPFTLPATCDNNPNFAIKLWMNYQDTGGNLNDGVSFDDVTVTGTSGAAPNITLTGESSNDNFGYSVSCAGDLNNDSASDVIIGAPGYENNRGRAYIIFGDAGLNIVNDTQAEFNTATTKTNVYATSAGDVNLTESGGAVEKTKKYDFSTGAGVDKWNYYCDMANGVSFDPNTFSQGTENEIGSDQYTYIATPDDNGLSLDTVRPKTFRWSYRISESKDTVTQIYALGRVMSEDPDLHQLYIWNSATTIWELLAGSSQQDIWEDMSGTISSNCANYIDENGDVHVLIFIIDPGNVARWLQEDYACIEITYMASSYNPSGTLISIDTTTEFNIGEITAVIEADIPSKTDLVIKISRDGGNTWSPSVGGLISGEPYRFTEEEPAGNKLRYKAIFSSDTSTTPVLHKITIYYSTGANDIVLTGECAGDSFGYSVSGAGDMDSDGYEDVIIGAPFNGNNNGSIYVFYGDTIMDIGADYINYGNSNENLGFSVCSLGNVNNDNYDDVIAGAPNTANGNAYVYTTQPMGEVDNPPTSNANVPASYWKMSVPFNVDWSASDDNGLASVGLFYRYSNDNSSWGGWTIFEWDETVSGLSASGTFSFTTPSGDGYYEFYTVANDTKPQSETKTSADSIAGVDTAPPTSYVVDIAPYWKTTIPFTITATASDDTSGVKEVALYYNYSADNSTGWTGWVLFGINATVAPYEWLFDAPEGDGYYRFYSLATDNATNQETDIPLEYDQIAGVDREKPEILDVLDSPDPQQINGYVNITATITDNVEMGEVYLNITGPNGQENISITQNLTGSTYYCNKTYSDKGIYSYFVWVRDKAGNQNSSDMYYFEIDTTKPEISSVQASPDLETSGGYINISAMVTDNYQVDMVWLNITYPDDTYENISITLNKTGSTYYCNRTYTMLGWYNYTIWANDTSNNWNNSNVYSFNITGALDTDPPQISIPPTASPDPQEVNNWVNITVYVSDNVEVSSVKVNISYPNGTLLGNFSMTGISLDANGNGTYYYNTTYSETGDYSYFIWTEDSSNNENATISYTFTMHDTEKPEISSVQANPEEQSTGGFVNISAVVTDNHEVNEVYLNITYPDGHSENLSITQNVTGSIYYCNKTYTMLGWYNYTIWANDSSNNWNYSATYSFNITVAPDTELPEITNIQDTPDPQEAGGYVNITVTVTDNVAVVDVFLNITYPDSSYENISITQNKTGDTYYCNKTYSVLGEYSYFVWANDTSSNGNKSSTFTFRIVTIDYIVIEDTTGGTGNPIGEMPYSVGGGDTYYAVGYNYTSGYVKEVACLWNCTDSSIIDINVFDTYVSFTTLAAGTCYIRAENVTLGLSDITETITVGAKALKTAENCEKNNKVSDNTSPAPSFSLLIMFFVLPFGAVLSANTKGKFSKKMFIFIILVTLVFSAVSNLAASETVWVTDNPTGTGTVTGSYLNTTDYAEGKSQDIDEELIGGSDTYVYVDAASDENVLEGADAGGSYLDTQSDNSVTRNITEQDFGTSELNVTNYVDENTTTYGTIDNFNYAQDEDGNYATLTEENTGGAAGSEWLDCNAFDATYDTFQAKVGASPYLDAQDQPTNYVYEDKTAGAEIGWFDFPSTSLTGSGITVNISVYCNNDDGVGDDYSDVYLDYEGGTGTDVGDVCQHTDWAYDVITLAGTYSATQINAMRVRFTTVNVGGGDDQRIDHVRLGVYRATSTNYELNITFNTTSVVSAANYYLELNYSANGENYDVLVYNATSTGWDDVGDLTDATMTQKNFTLAGDHYNGGNVRVRYVGQTETGDTSQSTLYIEYHRIRSYTPASPDYTLEATYLLDNIGSESSYSLEVQANYSGESIEEFNITYQIDGSGAWYVLGYVNSMVEQTFTDTLPVNPTNNVTVRIVDNTSGASPTANTLRIDFIELHGTSGYYDLEINYTFNFTSIPPGDFDVNIRAYYDDAGAEPCSILAFNYTLNDFEDTTYNVFSGGSYVWTNFTLSNDFVNSTTGIVNIRYKADTPAGDTDMGTLSIDYQCVVFTPAGDTEKPQISNVQDTPDPQMPGGYVNITANITDNVGVDSVYVNITGPAGFTPVNTSMTRISETDDYYYNTTYTVNGTYYYFIWANDTSNNGNTSSTSTFEILKIDYIVIENSAGTAVGEMSFSVSDTYKYYAKGYNITYGYSKDVNCVWGSNNTAVGTVTSPGTFTTFTAAGPGKCYVRAENVTLGLSDITKTITVTGAANNPPNKPTGLGVQGFVSGPGLIHITDDTPVLNWTFTDPDGNDQGGYNISVWNGSVGSGTLMWYKNSTGSGTTVTYGDGGEPTAEPPLGDGYCYNLSVEVNDTGGLWNTSDPLMFRMNTPPTAPTGTTNLGDYLTDHTPTVSWTAGTDAESDTITYYVYVSTTPAPTTWEWSGAATTCDLGNTVTLLDGTTYYWRIEANDSYEDSSFAPDDNGDQFRMNTLPTTSYLYVENFAPSTSDILNITNHYPSFNWTYSDPEGSTQSAFNISVWNGSVGSGILMWWKNATDNNNSATYDEIGGGMSALPLTDGHDYNVSVKTYDSYEWGGWVEVKFHMNMVPLTPTLNSPANETTLVETTTQTVSWNSVTDPEGSTITYWWQISTNTAFTAIIAQNNITSTTSQQFTTTAGNTYYWHVKSKDPYEEGIWSGYYWFNTISGNAAPTTDNAAVDGFYDATSEILNITSITPMFNFTYNDGNSDNMYQRNFTVLDSTMTVIWYDNNTWTVIPGTNVGITYTGPALVDGNDYYLMVTCNDTRGTGDSIWSTVVQVKFHMNTVPTTSTNSAPGDGTNQVEGTQTIQWTSVTDAESGSTITYYWYVSEDDPIFTLPLHATGSTTSTSDSFTTTAGSVYYWRVGAYDGYEYGSNSTETSFNTIAGNAPPTCDNVAVDGFYDGTSEILNITDHTPDLNFTYNDGNNDNMFQRNFTVLDSGMSVIWFDNSTLSVTPGTTVLLPYTGPALVDGNDYYFRVTCNDTRITGSSLWSNVVEVKFHMNSLPITSAVTVESFSEGTSDILNITYHTPDIGWGYSDSEGSQSDYNVSVWTGQDRTGTLMGYTNSSGSGTTWTYSGNPLVDSQDYYANVQTKDGYEWSNWMEGKFHMNTMPTTSNVGVQGYLSGSSILNITYHTPDINWVYTDTEESTQSDYNVSVWTGADRTGTLMGYTNSSGSGTTWTYTGNALIDGQDYYANVQTKDNYEWSTWTEVKFHMNTPPNPPTLTGPVNDTWSNNNTPRFEWSYSDPEGSQQNGFNVSIDDNPVFTSIDYYNNSSSSNPYWDFSPGSLPDGIWYWKVKTFDGYEWSDWGIWNVTKIDITEPTLTLSDPTGLDNWYNGSDTIYLNATDTGIGVKYIRYKIDGGWLGQWEEVNENTTITVDDGEHKIEYYAVDNLGNNETNPNITTEYIKVDRTGPAIVHTPLEDPQRNGPYNITVVVTDATSGMNLSDDGRVRIYINITNATGVSTPWFSDNMTGIDNTNVYYYELNVSEILLEYEFLDESDNAVIRYYITANDKAGNMETTDECMFEIDLSPITENDIRFSHYQTLVGEKVRVKASVYNNNTAEKTFNVKFYLQYWSETGGWEDKKLINTTYLTISQEGWNTTDWIEFTIPDNATESKHVSNIWGDYYQIRIKVVVSGSPEDNATKTLDVVYNPSPAPVKSFDPTLPTLFLAALFVALLSLKSKNKRRKQP